MIIEEFNEKVK